MRDLQTEFDDRPLKYQTMGSVLINRAERIGDEPFLHYGPEDLTLSYAAVNERANAIGNGLRSLGVEPGDRVSVMVSDALEALLSMFGINKCGGVYSPINYDYRGGTLRYQLKDSAPSVLVVQDEFVPRLNEVREDLDALPYVVVYEAGHGGEPPDASFPHSTFAEVSAAGTAPPPVTTEWDDPASIVYTSGTTGYPKGVVIPYRWIFSNYTLGTQITLNQDDVVHCALPLYHIGGLYADATSALISGASVALWDRFSRSSFWERVNRYSATRVMLLSVMISWLKKQPERPDDRENTLTKVSMTPLPDDYEEIARRFGFDFVRIGYGQTESGAFLSALVHAARGDDATPAHLRKGKSPEAIVADAEDLGIPVVTDIPGNRFLGRPHDWLMEVTVLDDRDQEVPPCEVGELAVRPREPGLVLQEYLGKPEATVEEISNLWWHTGDAVYRDGANNYFFVDRIGDVIRRRGENISSLQIQDAANKHPAIAATAAFPIPAPDGGEDDICIAVETRDTLDESELWGFLEERLPEFMVPGYVRFVDEIPTTETNKMQKFKLREELFDV
jgi:crotonobetaine/carnitine-CoA ligase